MIARENQVIVRIEAHEMPGRLPHGVCGALKPVGALGCLFSRENLDESRAEKIHAIRLADMPVERSRVELRQYKNAANVGMQAVADRNIDQPVLAADWNRRLRSELREREEAFPLPTS